MSTRIQRNICLGIFSVAMINFVAFWAIAVYLGGDAVNGKIQSGHFFLMSHGGYTEVSQAVFDYSRWHVYSTWVTHPLGLAAAYWYYRVRDGNGRRA
jgi:purine-cytosine permease-like protein